MHIVPSIGSIAIAAGGRGTSRVANSSEAAQAQPPLQALSKLSGTVELDPARSNGALHCKIAHEHARHCLQVGRNVKTDLEAWIGGTKIELLAIADQPPAAVRHGQIGTTESTTDPAGC